MKVSKDIVNQRRVDIMKYIENHNAATVDELVNLLHASPATIRRDLQYWQDQGAIYRKYGKAILVQAFIEDHDYNRNRFIRAIAKRAALYIEDGDIIFINASRTALMVSEYLKEKKVTIITNNIKLSNIKEDGYITWIMTGGQMGPTHSYTTGDFALMSIGCVTATKCFLGCAGLKENGVSTGGMSEMSVNRAMLAQTAGQKFLLCDHSKVGLDSNYYFSDFSDIDYLITDDEADRNIINRIRKNHNINIIKVEPMSND